MGVNAKAYVQKYLKIKNKAAKIVPFVLNQPQAKLYDAIKSQAEQGKPQRLIVLKARQMGFSTLTEAIIFKLTATARNVRSGIVAHEKDATTNLYNMFNRYYDNLPDLLKPEKTVSNAKELVFDNKAKTGLNSSIRCMTAGNQVIGRSDTFQNLHISEYAFWEGDKGDVLDGLLQAVPNLPNTLVIIESTANGFDDFKDLWDRAVAGESEYIPIFCAWWELDEYQMPYTGFELTAEEQEIKTLYILSNEQLEWRRWCIRNNCRGNVSKFKQEYPSCPEEAFIMSGKPVFDVEAVISRINRLKIIQEQEPIKTGRMTYEFNDAEYQDYIVDNTISLGSGDTIRFYEMPQHGVPYVIGGDTKGEGSDYYTATVVNNVTGNRCATLKMQLMDSKPYVWQVYALGMYYNTALIGIEINFNTAPVEELTRLKYPKQYVRQRTDDYTKKLLTKFGWKTDGITRPLIIDKYTTLIRENIHLIHDIETLQECLTFVEDKNGRPDAMSGKHDDLLFSDMIASEIRTQQTFDTLPESINRNHWTDDMWEDYHNASDADKKYLDRKWGK